MMFSPTCERTDFRKRQRRGIFAERETPNSVSASGADGIWHFAFYKDAAPLALTINPQT
jgi:hypothetical protein